jgi:tripartite-type tricarboxylate transporter receptor subunit TctC
VVAYVKSGDMKPIITLMYEPPKGFEETPTLTDFGYKIKILWRFRGFWAPKAVPQDRMKYLEWAFHEAFKSDAYQKFNKSKYMDLVPSYKNSADSIELINTTLESYMPMYKELGIKVMK